MLQATLNRLHSLYVYMLIYTYNSKIGHEFQRSEGEDVGKDHERGWREEKKGENGIIIFQ